MSRVPAALFVLLLAVPPALAVPAPVKAPIKLKVGDLAPQFVRGDLQGHIFDLKAQRGKIVLIDFWASWCAPCIIEIPHLGQLQKRYGGRGFQVVGVAMDDSAATTKETMQKTPFNYPVVSGDARFGNLYGGVLGLPLQYLAISGRGGRKNPGHLERGIGARHAGQRGCRCAEEDKPGLNARFAPIADIRRHIAKPATSPSPNTLSARNAD